MVAVINVASVRISIQMSRN